MKFFRYINLGYVDYVVICCLLVAAFLIPIFNLPAAAGLANAVPAVFAIAAGFFINDAMQNYLRLQTLIAEEDATLISLAHALRSAPGIDSGPVERAIDAYLIKVLEANNIDHISHSQKEFEALLSSIDAAIRETASTESVDETLQSDRDRLLDISQEVTIAARTNLTFSHWLLLGILGVLVCVTLLAMRDGTLLAEITIGLMMVAVYAILVVLRDIDNNQYLERKLAFKTSVRVFYALNTPPYFPPGIPKNRIIPDEKGQYRTTNEKGEIELVTKTV